MNTILRTLVFSSVAQITDLVELEAGIPAVSGCEGRMRVIPDCTVTLYAGVSILAVDGLSVHVRIHQQFQAASVSEL